MLVQRAAWEGPRWTRAVGDHLARPQGEGKMRAVNDSLVAPLEGKVEKMRRKDSCLQSPHEATFFT